MKSNLMKKIMAGALALSMVFSMTACGSGGSGTSSDSGEKTKLYVVNWKDYASDDEELMAAFEEEYNCEIVNTYMDSEEDLLTKLKTGAEGEIDVCLPNCTILPAAIEGGYLEQIDTAKIENFEKLFDKFKTKHVCRTVCMGLYSYRLQHRRYQRSSEEHEYSRRRSVQRQDRFPRRLQ